MEDEPEDYITPKDTLEIVLEQFKDEVKTLLLKDLVPKNTWTLKPPKDEVDGFQLNEKKAMMLKKVTTSKKVKMNQKDSP